MKFFIITKETNQLGNRLFQFSHILATSKENNAIVFHFGFQPYHQYFEFSTCGPLPVVPRISKISSRLLIFLFIKLKKYIDKKTNNKRFSSFLPFFPFLYFKSGWNSTNEELSGLIDLHQAAQASAIKNHTVVFFDGPLFQNFPALSKHQTIIREYFTPLNTHLTAAKKIARIAKGQADILIGVHIRRGDYKDFIGGKYYYSYAEYAELMWRIIPLFPKQKVSFLICSDDSPEFSDFPDLNIHFSSGHIIEDLYALAHCDYIIGPPSTFSAWAAFWGEKPYFHVEHPKTHISIDSFSLFFG